MLGSCEYANESPEHQLEPAFRVLKRKLRDWLLFSYNELLEPNPRSAGHWDPTPPEGRRARRSVRLHPCPKADGSGFERLGLKYRMGCHACTGQTCLTQKGPAAGRLSCGAH